LVFDCLPDAFEWKFFKRSGPDDPGFSQTDGHGGLCGQRTEPLYLFTDPQPFPFMEHVPATGNPVADQFEINNYMKNVLKNRYKEQV
jgi:hypothetical protein